MLARLDVRLDVGEPARGLTLAEQQTVEIAKAISLDVRVLIMDEPTASLSAHEVRRSTASPCHRSPQRHARNQNLADNFAISRSAPFTVRLMEWIMQGSDRIYGHG